MGPSLEISALQKPPGHLPAWIQAPQPGQSPCVPGLALALIGISGGSCRVPPSAFLLFFLASGLEGRPPRPLILSLLATDHSPDPPASLPPSSRPAGHEQPRCQLPRPGHTLSPKLRPRLARTGPAAGHLPPLHRLSSPGLSLPDDESEEDVAEALLPAPLFLGPVRPGQVFRSHRVV